MIRPEFGLCLPCRVEHVHTAYVIDVSLVMPRLLTIHLANLDTPDGNTLEGKRATEFASTVLDEAADDLAVWVPASNIRTRFLVAVVALRLVTGDIWVGTEDRLSEMLVNAKHAVRIVR